MAVLARDLERLRGQRVGVSVVRGDAAVYPELVAGAGAVLSALGPVKGGATDLITLAAQPLAGVGVSHPGDTPTLTDRAVRALLRLTQPALLADAARHADLIRAGALDWTVVRVPRLTDGPPRAVTPGRVGTIRPFVTRASVARFMLDALDGPATSRQAPAISN